MANSLHHPAGLAITNSVHAAPLILQAQDLHFGYPGHALFRLLSIAIPPGITLIQGGDGRGKTTLMRLLAGDLKADAGQLQINGVSLQAQPAAYLQQLFWIDPRTEAFDQITALEFLESQRARYPAFDEQVLARLLVGLDLADHAHKQLFMLSTGSKRKVWMAAAFASGACVTLLDMPFAALDKASIAFVLNLLKDSAQHTTRAWVLADYEAPAGVPLASKINLGD